MVQRLARALFGTSVRRCARQSRRPWRLSVESITCQGAISLSVQLRISSRTWLTATRSLVASGRFSSLHLIRSAICAWKRRSCSSSSAANQYLTKWTPDKLTARLKSAHTQEFVEFGLTTDAQGSFQRRRVIPTAIQNDYVPRQGEIFHIPLEMPLLAYALAVALEGDHPTYLVVQSAFDLAS